MNVSGTTGHVWFSHPLLTPTLTRSLCIFDFRFGSIFTWTEFSSEIKCKHLLGYGSAYHPLNSQSHSNAIQTWRWTAHICGIILEVASDSVFLEWCIVPYGLWEIVIQAMQTKCQKESITAVESRNPAIPIVTPLNTDGQTPRICGNYQVTLKKSLRRAFTTEEPEDILYRFASSKVFSKIGLWGTYLQTTLDSAPVLLTALNTPFGL